MYMMLHVLGSTVLHLPSALPAGLGAVMHHLQQQHQHEQHQHQRQNQQQMYHLKHRAQLLEQHIQMAIQHLNELSCWPAEFLQVPASSSSSRCLQESGHRPCPTAEPKHYSTVLLQSMFEPAWVDQVCQESCKLCCCVTTLQELSTAATCAVSDVQRYLHVSLHTSCYQASYCVTTLTWHHMHIACDEIYGLPQVLSMSQEDTVARLKQLVGQCAIMAVKAAAADSCTPAAAAAAAAAAEAASAGSSTAAYGGGGYATTDNCSLAMQTQHGWNEQQQQRQQLWGDLKQPAAAGIYGGGVSTHPSDAPAAAAARVDISSSLSAAGQQARPPPLEYTALMLTLLFFDEARFASIQVCSRQQTGVPGTAMVQSCIDTTCCTNGCAQQITSWRLWNTTSAFVQNGSEMQSCGDCGAVVQEPKGNALRLCCWFASGCGCYVRS
jgi:hypothetical protein